MKHVPVMLWRMADGSPEFVCEIEGIQHPEGSINIVLDNNGMENLYVVFRDAFETMVEERLSVDRSEDFHGPTYARE